MRRLYCVRESCLCITPGSLTGWHEAEGDLGTNEAITILFPYLEGLDALQLRGIFQVRWESVARATTILACMMLPG